MLVPLVFLMGVTRAHWLLVVIACVGFPAHPFLVDFELATRLDPLGHFAMRTAFMLSLTYAIGLAVNWLYRRFNTVGTHRERAASGSAQAH